VKSRFEKFYFRARGAIKRRLSRILQYCKYKNLKDYNAKLYWSDRLLKYGVSFRGVGRIDLSENANKRMYREARQAFLRLCDEHDVKFSDISMLDIGCGTGFYAKIYQENGGKKYLGVDITDVLFPMLRREFPGFEFRRLDISMENLSGKFDLVIMIDVTQHIISSRKFSHAMENVRTCLNKNGLFITTSWLSNRISNSFYEVGRSMEVYKKRI